MNNLQNIKFVLNKLSISPVNYGKNINQFLTLVEKDSYNLIKNPDTEIIFKMPVNKDLCNIQLTMHGGAISTLIDISTTIAISGMDRNLRHNVSVELSTYFLNPIKISSNILILCKIPKIGKTLSYSYADIYDEETLKLCANGSHVKAMLEKTWKE
jgi:uncharacterized protein (TIGR00369 family)